MKGLNVPKDQDDKKKKRKPRRKKRNKGSHKGARYEREIAVKLSEWWSWGKRDDIFYRTHGSGSRATVRNKAGRSTSGQNGDIGLSDFMGKPLLDVLTFSLKCGYRNIGLQDLFDLPTKNKIRVLEQWLDEAAQAANSAQSFAWALIIKRDYRDAIILIPMHFFKQIGGGELATLYVPKAGLIGVQRLRWFLQINPQEIQAIAEDHAS